MSVTQIDVQQLSSRWDEILSLAQAGAEIVITDQAVPRAKLIAMTPTTPRTPGLHLGAIKTTEDFDAPLDDSFWMGEKS